jgi:hypothetical protein
MHRHLRIPSGRRSFLLVLLSVAQLMVILDISAVNVALPELAGDLGIARADIGWTITSYSLMFGSLLLLGGRAADLLGRRRVFMAGLGVFTLSSLATALAGDATMLFAARAGQGLGAAMLSPAALSIITTSFHGADRARALGVGAASLAVLAGFAALELRTAQPLLRVQRLADRAVGGGFAMMLTASAIMFGSFLLSSLYLQNVLGTGALETGLAFLPFAAVIGAGVHVAGQVITRVGVRLPLAAGFAIAAGGLTLLSQVHATGSYVGDILPGMLIVGVGLGMILVSVSVAVLTGASDEESGMLSGLNTTGHEVGGSLGIAILATIATSSVGGTATGIGDAFLVAAGIAGVAGLAALLILPSARSFLPKLALAPRVAVH